MDDDEWLSGSDDDEMDEEDDFAGGYGSGYDDDDGAYISDNDVDTEVHTISPDRCESIDWDIKETPDIDKAECEPSEPSRTHTHQLDPKSSFELIESLWRAIGKLNDRNCPVRDTSSEQSMRKFARIHAAVSKVSNGVWPSAPMLTQRNLSLTAWARRCRTFLDHAARAFFLHQEWAQVVDQSLEATLARFQSSVTDGLPKYALSHLARTLERRYVNRCFKDGDISNFRPDDDDDDDGKEALQHVAKQFHSQLPMLSDEINLAILVGFGRFPLDRYRRRLQRKRTRENDCQPTFEQSCNPNRDQWDPDE